MLLCKLLGALLVALAGVLGAIRLNRAAEGRIDEVEGWIALLRLTKTEIDCFSLPQSEILARCDGAILRRIGWEGETPPADFASLEAVLDRCGLSPEGERIARIFLGEIGRGYRREQLRICDYGIGLFTAERDRLLAELPKRRQRNAVLSMTLSLGAVVLLL